MVALDHSGITPTSASILARADWFAFKAYEIAWPSAFITNNLNLDSLRRGV